MHLADTPVLADIADITRIAASVGLLTGLLWVIILLFRKAWHSVLDNALEDNRRLREQDKAKDELIDRLRAELRVEQRRVDELEGDVRDLKHQALQLKDRLAGYEDREDD